MSETNLKEQKALLEKAHLSLILLLTVSVGFIKTTYHNGLEYGVVYILVFGFVVFRSLDVLRLIFSADRSGVGRFFIFILFALVSIYILLSGIDDMFVFPLMFFYFFVSRKMVRVALC